MKRYAPHIIVVLWVLAVFMRVGGYTLLAILASITVVWLFRALGSGRKVPVK